jgi:hypothetical protein
MARVCSSTTNINNLKISQSSLSAMESVKAQPFLSFPIIGISKSIKLHPIIVGTQNCRATPG